MESKTQAQKRADREQRLAEQAAQRKKEQEAKIAAIQKQLQETTLTSNPSILSKKDKRKLKHAQTEQHSNGEKEADPNQVSQASEDQTTSTTSPSLSPSLSPPSSYTTVHQMLISNTDRSVSSALDIQKMAKEVVKQERADSSGANAAPAAATSSSPARIVYNHSTHCHGLRPVLVRLQNELLGSTITPGKITTVANHADEFELRFQRREQNGQFKLVARSGTMAQDVFISISDKVENPEELIRDAVARALSKTSSDANSTAVLAALTDVPSSALNRAIAEERNNEWRGERQKRDQERKEKEKESKEKKKFDERMRKLANKQIPSGQRAVYAERDEAIVSGHERGKHSMS